MASNKQEATEILKELLEPVKLDRIEKMQASSVFSDEEVDKFIVEWDERVERFIWFLVEAAAEEGRGQIR